MCQIWVEVATPGVTPTAMRALLSGVHVSARMPLQRAGPRVFSGPPLAGTSTGAPRYPLGPGVLTPAAIHLPSGDQMGSVIVRMGGLVLFSMRMSEPSRRAVVHCVSVRVLSTPM